MSDLNEVLKFLKEGIAKFRKAEIMQFQDIIKSNWQPQKEVLGFVGVYAIFEKNKGLIYIGSAGKGGHHIKYRMADLFYFGSKKFKHTLTEKFLTTLGRFKTIDEVRSFYFQKCYIKVVETKNIRQARILEEVLIYLYNPKYNQE